MDRPGTGKSLRRVLARPLKPMISGRPMFRPGIDLPQESGAPPGIRHGRRTGPVPPGTPAANGWRGWLAWSATLRASPGREVAACHWRHARRVPPIQEQAPAMRDIRQCGFERRWPVSTQPTLRRKWCTCSSLSCILPDGEEAHPVRSTVIQYCTSLRICAGGASPVRATLDRIVEHHGFTAEQPEAHTATRP